MAMSVKAVRHLFQRITMLRFCFAQASTRGRGSLLSIRMRWALTYTRPNFAGGYSAPQTDLCFGPNIFAEANRALDWVQTFSLKQTDLCFASRRPLPRPGKFAWYKNEVSFALHPVRLRRRPQRVPNYARVFAPRS